MVRNFPTAKHLSENSHHLWKKSLQNFWKYFFRAEKRLFIARQKSPPSLAHSLCPE